MPSSIFVVGHLGSSRLSHYFELLHYYGVLPYIIDDIVKYFWENIGIDKIPRFVSSGEKYFPLLLTYGNFLTFIYLRDVQLHQFIQKRNYDRRTKKIFLTLYPFAEVPIKNRKWHTCLRGFLQSWRDKVKFFCYKQTNHLLFHLEGNEHLSFRSTKFGPLPFTTEK